MPKKSYSRSDTEKIIRKLEKERGKKFNQIPPKLIGAALGVASAIPMGRAFNKLLLKDIYKVSPQLKKPSTLNIDFRSGLVGLTGGTILGEDYNDKVKNRYAREKGVFLDSNLVKRDTIKRMTSKAEDKYLNKKANLLGLEQIMPGVGRVLGWGAAAPFTDDPDKKFTAKNIGTIAGIVGGAALYPYLAKKYYVKQLKNQGYAFSGGKWKHVGSDIVHRPIKSFFKDLGIMYNKGKLYDESGNLITKKKEVKNKFRDLVKQTHPDRGGDQNEFIKVKNAFERIKDSKEFQKLSFFKNMFNEVQ